MLRYREPGPVSPQFSVLSPRRSMDKLAAVLLVSLAVIIMLALNLFFSLFHMYMIKKRYESQPRLLNVLYFLLAISIQVRLGWGPHCD